MIEYCTQQPMHTTSKSGAGAKTIEDDESDEAIIYLFLVKYYSKKLECILYLNLTKK